MTKSALCSALSKTPDGSVAIRRVIARMAPLLFVALSGCVGETPAAITLGEVAVPLADYEALGALEQAVLLDLVALGSVVSHAELEQLVEPLVTRAEDESRARALPFHLAAQLQGYDEAGLRELYGASPDWELDVRHAIRLVDGGDPVARRDSALSIAGEVARRAQAGEDFAALAAAWSEEPGAAARGGLLEPGRRGSWVDPFWEAASALSPGEVSGVVETEYGYHVLRLDARRPIPFAEVDRTTLLRRIFPVSLAGDAMEHWLRENGAVQVDSGAAAAVRMSLLAGNVPADSLIIARGAGASYTASDLIAGWAVLEEGRRAELEAGSEADFTNWVEADAGPILWAGAAEGMGVTADPAAGTLERDRWLGQLGAWAQQVGFTADMDPADIYEAARLGTLSGVAEARSLRSAVRSLRPLLRRAYPATWPVG